MRPAVRGSLAGGMDRAAAAVALLGLAIAVVLSAGIAEAGAAQGEAQACGDVVVQFKPEGSGGAHAIRATGIGCGPARNIARSCIKGTVASGWTAVNWDGRVYLSQVGKKIRYTGVGGGGCGLPQKSCPDFSYRGVGFFTVEVVGTSCGEGGVVSLGKAWYDRGGNCSFGSTCRVRRYRCEAVSSTATVTCVRANGYRARWQMGE